MVCRHFKPFHGKSLAVDGDHFLQPTTEVVGYDHPGKGIASTVWPGMPGILMNDRA